MHFCTSIDSNYLTRGLALYESLRRHGPRGAFLHVLCLDERVADALRTLDLPGLHPIARADFEAGDDDLAAARANRTLVEYYFTCKPSLLLYLLRRYPEIEQLFHLDADLFFFSTAAALAEEMGCGSVYVVPHRFPPALAGYRAFGRFNVGLVGFRNDGEGRRCLHSWRQQCNFWCYDRQEDGKFAEQKYLDAWPEQFSGVVISRHPGVNLAPWNKARHRLSDHDGQPQVDGQPVVCYHFHGLKTYEGGLILPQALNYANWLDANWLRLIYEPYLDELENLSNFRPAGPEIDLRASTNLTLPSAPHTNQYAQFLIRRENRWVEVPPDQIRQMYTKGLTPG